MLGTRESLLHCVACAQQQHAGTLAHGALRATTNHSITGALSKYCALILPTRAPKVECGCAEAAWPIICSAEGQRIQVFMDMGGKGGLRVANKLMHGTHTWPVSL